MGFSTNTKLLNYLLIAFFLVGAISMLYMSTHYFEYDVTGVMKGKSVTNEPWYGFSLRGHIVTGLFAIFIGPFQFIEWLRLNYTAVHKQIGYVYAVSVFISGVFGLVVAQFAMGGIISRLGFSLLALCWIYSLIKSITAIRKKDIQQHQKFMFINYGLTFAAIPQRTLLAAALIPQVEFMDVYRLSAWLPWILNVVLALFLYNKFSHKHHHSSP